MNYFIEKEFVCPCCGESDMRVGVMYALDLARGYAGVPFQITSGYRCEKHNKAIGGSPTSSHLNGTAVDVACTDSHRRWCIVDGLIGAGFNRIGIADTFVHADMDRHKTSNVIWTY